MIRQRQYNIDLLRILACFMVVFLHVSANCWDAVPVSSFEWKVFNFYDTAVRSSVPLFFMISGMLFLTKESLSTKRLFTKNIAKLVFIYFLWSALYAIDALGLRGIIHNFNFREFVHAVLASKYHLWYLPSLISVYLLLPVIFAVKDHENGRVLRYILLFFLLFAVLRSSIKALPCPENLRALLNKFDFAFASFCGYFILGYVLHKNIDRISVKSVFLLLIFVAVVVLTAIGNYAISAAKGEPSEALYNYFFISTFIEAAVLFVLFLRMPTGTISDKSGKLIGKISRYTFFIYLFHPFLLDHLNANFGLNPLSMNALISVPLIALLVFIVCLAAAFIVEKIPFINKVLY